MNWWRRLRHDDDLEMHLDAELRDHLERQAVDYIAQGMSDADARRRARLEFGGVDQVKEVCRDARGTRWAIDIAQDVRFAARLLMKDRWFTLAAVVALAVGIGLNGTMFTIVNAMTRGLPIEHADRIVSIDARDGAGHWRGLGGSYRDFLDFQAGMKTVSGLAAFSQTGTTLGDDDHVNEPAAMCYVSANTFQLLGETPVLGRSFLPEDDRPGAPAIVILGGSIWKARYDSDPALIGRTIRIGGVPAIVVGVMPDGFRFPVLSDVWQPLALQPGLDSQRRDTRALHVFGVLADRKSRAQAQSEAGGIADRLSREYPDTNRNVGAVVAAFPGPFAPDPILRALMAAVGFVLFVASANVASLLLARSAARAHEMATRAALGATRWRIVRQLLVEGGLLACAAGASGLAFSLVGVWLFSKAVLGINFPYYIQWTMDRQVLWFVAAACLGTGCFVGLLPALHVAHTATHRSVNEGGRTATSGVDRRRWTTALLIAELALTLILLDGAGLMMRSFLAVYRADLVVDAAHVTAMPLTLPRPAYGTPSQRIAFYETLERHVEAIPGVSSAAFANVVPFSGGPARHLAIEGRAFVQGEPQPTVSFVTVRGRYFETLGVGVLHGRTFIDADGVPGREGAIVNQRLVTLFFPHAAPIGQRIRLTPMNGPPGTPPDWITIVGVSPTVRQQYFQDLDPVVYVPDQADVGGMTLIVRSLASSPGSVSPLVRGAVSQLDADISLGTIRPLEWFMTTSRWGHRVFGGLLTVFAFIALALAAVGLYAVTAYSVVQRTQEIGVRMALGAQAGAIVWLFVERTMRPLSIGLGIGVIGALGMGRLLRGFLIQTSATDPATMAGIAVLLAAVCAAACVFPARGAACLDPLKALRYE
jgi:predicted permease